MTAARTAKSLLAGLALAALIATPLRAETPRDLRLSYMVWIGGFNSLGIEARLQHTETSYRVGLEGRSRGLLGWLWPYRLRLESEGRRAPDRLTPRRFRQAEGQTGERRREIRYLGNGALELSLDGRTTPLERDGLSENLVRGALDPASAVLSIIEVFARESRCLRSLPVFDGKRRYDLKLIAEEQRSLAPSRYGVYSGPATLCRLAVEKHAGFRKRGRFPKAFDVWLAPAAEGAPALPVRLEGRNDLAPMIIHLTAAQTSGTAKQARRSGP